MSSDFDKGGRYDTTQTAWEDIWSEASVEVELEAVQSKRAQDTINAYLPYLAKDDVILEAGSGLSAVIITLREMGYNIIGLDYAINALYISRQHTPDLPLIGGDIHALPYADNAIGAYLSFGVLEHFEHGMQPALKEAYRVLRPGGILVLTIPYPNIVNKIVKWKRSLRGEVILNDDDFYESTYTRGQLVDNCEQAGFDVQEAIPTSHSYTLWGLGGPFRADGYYRTSQLAETIGGITRKILPWVFNFETLIIARK